MPPSFVRGGMALPCHRAFFFGKGLFLMGECAAAHSPIKKESLIEMAAIVVEFPPRNSGIPLGVDWTADTNDTVDKWDGTADAYPRYKYTVSGGVYGNGEYIAWSNSQSGTTWLPPGGFDKSYIGGDGGWQIDQDGAHPDYSSTTDVTIPSYLSITLPERIHLKSYNFVPRDDVAADSQPTKWNLYASNDDGVNWKFIQAWDNVAVSSIGGSRMLRVDDDHTQFFSSYKWEFLRSGGNSLINMVEIELFGVRNWSVAASSENSPAFGAFTGARADYWQSQDTSPSTASPQWLSIVFPRQVMMTGYSITSRDDETDVRFPTLWRLQGRNTGESSWENLETEDRVEATWDPNETKNYSTDVNPNRLVKNEYRLLIQGAKINNSDTIDDFVAIGDWSITTATPHSTGSSKLHALAQSPDGNSLYCETDGIVSCIDTVTMATKNMSRSAFSTDHLYGLALSGDGNTLYASFEDGSIHRLDSSTLAYATDGGGSVFTGLTGRTRSLVLSPDGAFLYASESINGGAQDEVFKLDAYTMKREKEGPFVGANGTAHGSTSMVLSPDGRYLFSGGRIDEKVHKIDTRTMRSVLAFGAHAGKIWSVKGVRRRDGGMNLIVGGDDDNLYVLDASDMTETARIPDSGRTTGMQVNDKLYRNEMRRTGIDVSSREGVKARGGDEVYDNAVYRIHVFKNTGQHELYVERGGMVDVLVVGGGGAGNVGGGGGGAGGVVHRVQHLLNPSSHTVFVGDGGVGGYASTSAKGQSSRLDDVVANGGGKGLYISYLDANDSNNGGSGGGGALFGGTPGQGIDGQGHDGGDGWQVDETGHTRGAGGGGADERGKQGTNTSAGDGGDGVMIPITGNEVHYGGGGGGSYQGDNYSRSLGGLGGGGKGGTHATDPETDGEDGHPGTGGGGGAGAEKGSQYTKNGDGGSGVVIVRYPKELNHGGGALDDLRVTTSPGIAYGLRRLFKDCHGPQVRVIRASDGVEADVFFDDIGLVRFLNASDGLFVDGTTSLDTWSNGATLDVTKWYDQSGNGNHARTETITYGVPPKLVKTDDARYVLDTMDYAQMTFTSGRYTCMAFQAASGASSHLQHFVTDNDDYSFRGRLWHEAGKHEFSRFGDHRINSEYLIHDDEHTRLNLTDGADGIHSGDWWRGDKNNLFVVSMNEGTGTRELPFDRLFSNNTFEASRGFRGWTSCILLWGTKVESSIGPTVHTVLRQYRKTKPYAPAPR